MVLVHNTIDAFITLVSLSMSALIAAHCDPRRCLHGE